MSKFQPKGDNPFTPGIGETPPCVAGREAEMAELSRYLRRLNELGKGKIVLMFAPRGNGKTVLLNHLEEQCKATGMTVVRAVPERDGCLALAKMQALLPPDTTPDSSQLSIGGGVNVGAAALNLQWTAKGAKQSRPFDDHLKEACDTAPRVLLVDEAHQWHGGDRPEFIGMCQPVMDKHPFFVVIAGTPGLMQVVSQGVSGIDRAPVICPGLLELAAAIDAIRIPLADGGIDISDTAIEQAANDAQRYPFFLQVWGSALWNYAAEHGIRRLSDEHAQAAKTAVDALRARFYERRFEEVAKDDNLRAAAIAVSDAFSVRGEYDHDGVVDIIDLAMTPGIPDERPRRQEAKALLERLIALGFVWKPGGRPAIHPGIPSLMTFVAAKRTERQPALPAADLQRIGEAAAKRLQAPL